ncbi:hypothetical protein IGS75_00695 [Gluconobacter sphaericus]|uniref:hypothetical protein n=1 Tax=Gluconobacter sphaericus TaxID=574987 RepID=UPI0019205564|nr:hypothetical protein [Gluconobacter sphaericus]QQX91202.1 hypothetical protein IGS75_00695 [Gluconobacter sphaericus]
MHAAAGNEWWNGIAPVRCILTPPILTLSFLGQPAGKTIIDYQSPLSACNTELVAGEDPTRQR